MIIYGYAKDYRYTGDGTLEIRVRIPTVHGPYDFKEFNGTQVKRYVQDKDLPYYPSLLLPHLPVEGEVVALEATDEGKEHFLILGLTGGYYTSSETNLSTR